MSNGVYMFNSCVQALFNLEELRKRGYTRTLASAMNINDDDTFDEHFLSIKRDLIKLGYDSLMSQLNYDD